MARAAVLVPLCSITNKGPEPNGEERVSIAKRDTGHLSSRPDTSDSKILIFSTTSQSPGKSEFFLESARPSGAELEMRCLLFLI